MPPPPPHRPSPSPAALTEVEAALALLPLLPHHQRLRAALGRLRAALVAVAALPDAAPGRWEQEQEEEEEEDEER